MRPTCSAWSRRSASSTTSARRDLVPALPHVLSLEALDELEERGRAYREEHPDALAHAESRIGEDDLFTFIYTSGTTGAPKACMIRHRNYYEMAATIDTLEEFTLDQDLLLLYLPLAHNYGRLLVLLGAYEGYTIAFLADPYATADALPKVRPTVLPSVPRLYEKVHTRIKGQFDEAVGLRRRLIDWALKVGREAIPYKLRDEPLPAGLARKHRIADRLVYSKVKDKLGGRLRVAISGGAPLAPEIAEFFLTLDILILEGYGLSECTTACAVNLPGRVKFGTVGRILPALRGEDRRGRRGPDPQRDRVRRLLQRRGGHARGDRRRRAGCTPATSARSTRTGTCGSPTARRTSSSPPAARTSRRRTSRTRSSRRTLVSQALVVGDRRPYVVALISLDEDELDGLSPEAAQETVQGIVDDVNRDRSRFEQIKRFAIVPRDFSAEEGEVTPTMKLKRRDRRAALRRRDREALRRLRGLGVAPRAVEDGRVIAGHR